MGAESRIHGGGVLSIERPCTSAASRHGLRSAECSHPQPTSIGNAERCLTVQARPPSLARASMMRQSRPASAIRRAAAMPAAPPPMIMTSVSLVLATFLSGDLDASGRSLESAVNNRHVSEKRQRLFVHAQVHARSLPANPMGTFGGVVR
jgi:hypothetical protein